MISDQKWIKYIDEKGEQLPSGMSIEILRTDESSKETKKLDVKDIITKRSKLNIKEKVFLMYLIIRKLLLILNQNLK